LGEGRAVNDDDAKLWALAATFGFLSFIAIGGANAIIPEMHRQAVDVHQWMTSGRFTDLFAIAQASPGPNILIVTLIGWDVAGLAGALVATLAMIVPTSVVAFKVGRVWHRFRSARWRIAIQAGVTPVTIGLIAASAYVLSRAADTNLALALLTLGTAVVLTLTRLHPLLLIGLGGVLGAVGLV
jgi:chromate transporter